MGSQFITYLREKKIFFTSAEDSNHTVEVFRSYYQEQGGPKIIKEVRDFLDDNETLKKLLEERGLNWGDTDEEITGKGGLL